MRALTPIIVFMILFATAAWAPADTIYSNFGSGQTYDTDQVSIYHYSGFEPLTYAVSFPSNGSYTLDSVSVAFHVDSAQNQSVDLVLYSDGGGKPGAVLSDLGSQVVPGSSTAIYTFSPSTDVMLSSGTTYWVGAIPAVGKVVLWFESLSDAHGYAQSVNDGASWTSASTTDITPLFSVSGTPVRSAATAAPLPSAAWAGLALLPLAMLAGLRRRRIA